MVHSLHVGEFGIVYKANLASRATCAAMNRVVAVKTLKGMDLECACSNSGEWSVEWHQANCWRLLSH